MPIFPLVVSDSWTQDLMSNEYTEELLVDFMIPSLEFGMLGSLNYRSVFDSKEI
jgi:hypothetical protein